MREVTLCYVLPSWTYPACNFIYGRLGWFDTLPVPGYQTTGILSGISRCCLLISYQATSQLTWRIFFKEYKEIQKWNINEISQIVTSSHDCADHFQLFLVSVVLKKPCQCQTKSILDYQTLQYWKSNVPKFVVCTSKYL